MEITNTPVPVEDENLPIIGEEPSTETYGVVVPEFLEQANFTDIGLNRAAAVSALAGMRYGDDNGTFSEAYDRHKVLLQSGSEPDLRNQIGERKAERNTQLTLEQTSPAALQASLDAMFNPDVYAMEEAAVDELIDLGLGNKTQAEVSVAEDFEDTVRDLAVKSQIIQGELDKIEAEVQGLGTAKLIGNWLAVAVPFNTTIRELGEGNFALRSGRALQERRESLMAMPLPEFKEAIKEYVGWLKSDRGLFGDNPVLNKAALENLLPDAQIEANLNTTLNILDVADVGSVPLSVGVSGIKSMFRKQVAQANNPIRQVAEVNPQLAVDTVSERVIAATNGVPEQGIVTNKGAVDMMLPSYASGTTDPSVGLSGDILRTVDANQQALANTLARSQTERLTAEEVNESFLDFRNQMLRRYKANEIKDVKYHTQDDITGVHKASVLFGKANGNGGFSTERSAKLSADKRGLANYDIIKNNDGQFYVRQVYDLPEEGYVRADTRIKEIKDYGVFSQVVNPHSWVSKRLSSDLQLADGRRAQLAATLNKTVVKSLSRLRNKENEALNTVLAKGMEYRWTDSTGKVNEGKWFTVEELKQQYEQAFNRLPQEREIEAYYAMKTLSDFDYTLRNRSVFTSLARTGYNYGEVTKIGYKGNVKVVERFDNAVNDRILDTTTDTYFDGNLTKEALQAKIDEGYSLLRLQEPIYRPTGKDNAPVFLVLAKRGDFKTGPLLPNQLPYRQGGHRLYAPNQKFAKQAFIGELENGSKFYGDPIVHAAAESNTRLEAFVSRFNAAREAVLAYKAGRNIGARNLDELELRMNEALEGADINDLDHWDELVANNRIRENTPMEIVNDGQMPLFGRAEASSMRDLRDKEVIMDDITRWVTHTNRPYTGKRGDRLMGPDDQLVKVVDPMETADLALQNAIRTGAYYDFRNAQIESWTTAARPYITNRTDESFNMTFSNPQWAPDIDTKFRSKLEAERRVIMRQLNMRTQSDIDAATWKQNAADWVEKATRGKVTQARAREALDVGSNDAIQAMRSMTYDLFLGMFNTGQLLVQSMTTAAITMVSPRNGLQSIAAYPALRFAIGKSDEAIDQLVREYPKLVRVGGYEPAQFKEMMRLYNDSGFGMVDEGLLLMGDTAPSARMGGVTKVRRAGRSILHEVERLNSSVAYSTAYKEYREKFPKGAVDSEGQRWILDRANALNMDMRNHAKSALSQGPLALASQFAQYPIHMLQNMLGKNTRFTQREQERLFIGSVIAFGAGGALPGGEDAVNWLAEQYQEATGKPLDPVGYKVLMSGVFDGMLYAISGGELNTDFGGRAGVGGWTSHFKDMWQNHSVVEMLAGAANPALTGLAGKILYNAQHIARSTYHGDLTASDLRIAGQDMLRAVSSFSTMERAYLMMMYGNEYSKSGMFQNGGRDEWDALLTVAGIPLAEATMAYDMYDDEKNRRDKINVAVKAIMANENQKLLTTDENVRQALSKRNASVLWALGDPRLELDVLSAVANRLPESFYEEMVKDTIQNNPLDPRANFAIETNKKVNENDGVQ